MDISGNSTIIRSPMLTAHDSTDWSSNSLDDSAKMGENNSVFCISKLDLWVHGITENYPRSYQRQR